MRQKYVYVLREGCARGAVKVGCSIAPRGRWMELCQGNPRRLDFIGSVVGGLSLERQLHECLRSEHVRGEWFCGELSDELVIAMSSYEHEDWSIDPILAFVDAHYSGEPYNRNIFVNKLRGEEYPYMRAVRR